MRMSLGWGLVLALGAAVFFATGCDDAAKSAAPDTGAEADTVQSDTGGGPADVAQDTTGPEDTAAVGDAGADAGDDAVGDAGTDTVAPTPTLVDWLVAKEHFGFVAGTYGKGTYCGAFEKGAIPGFADVRCTDTGGYLFSLNADGSLRMEETVYLHKITTQNPDGAWPWFVDNGFSGAVIYTLTPTEPALAGVDPAEAMEFDVQAVDGYGADGYWAYLGSEGAKTRMIMARGQTDDALLDWTTAEHDADTDTWTERGDAFPGWFIQRYPSGAFLGTACVAADRIPGATIDDGAGGTLDVGPGYCVPKCRMYTALNPDGANDLPVCGAETLAERPRAAALVGTPEATVAEWLVAQGQFAFVHGSYGKGTYCGAFEKGAIPGFADVRCTDTTNYLFAANADGTLRMEEAMYTYKITAPNPDGSMPYLVDDGYAGSLVWKLTPTAPSLPTDPADAMEFVAVMTEGYGPDGYWEWLGSTGGTQRMILARGQDDDVMLDWSTAHYDTDAATWSDDGDGFPGWFIQRYPVGAFHGTACPAAVRVPGADVSDGAGGSLAKGPGYCPPTCRMYTPADPTGANGLPVCAGAVLDEGPRAAALSPPAEPTVADWLLSEGLFSFVHGTYGKGSYCGAFEKGAIAGYETVRCTDSGSYVFSANDDGSIRLEEAVYVHAISAANPDGTFPWFVPGGYSGSIVYALTPTDPALNVNPADAMEFEAEIVDGFGPDSFWAGLAAAGGKSRMILARGQGGEALLDWTTATHDAATDTWTETGDAFPGWFIALFPAGAFYGKVCAEADRIAGAPLSDGSGGFLATGPGYCAPECRMSTEADPNGANGLPVCEGATLDEWPRASAL